MLARIARFVSRFPWPVAAAWALATAVLVIAAPPLRDVATQDNAAFLSEQAPSVEGGRVLARIWPEDEVGNTGALVFRRPDGLTDRDRAWIRDTEAWLRSDRAPEAVLRTQSVYSRPELRDALQSEDGTTTIVVIGFSRPPFTPITNEAVEAIRDQVIPAAPEGLRVHLTGNAGVGADQASAIDRSVEQTTVITLILVVLILLWVYRSPIAPLVPLVTVAVALGVSRGLVALMATTGLEVSALVETFMVVIVFGAGTDYCLFVVSRYKEELGLHQEGEDPPRRPVLVGTMVVIGGVIASSAATVVVGFASQGVAEFGLYRTTGPAMAVAVLITLAAGLTLTPALLAILGRRAFWPWRASRARPHDELETKAA
jgi:putative drug exporter of the RND superfamily